MNILVLDDGGSKGLASAILVQQFEQAIGPVAKHFDMICGVSTGAILGAHLALGGSGTGAVEYYKCLIPKLFRSPGPRFWRGITCPKYSSDTLDQELAYICGDTTLGELDQDLMILATQMSPRVTPKFWKSWDPQDGKILLRDITRASASAPGYFNPHTIGDEVYVDGGLCTNEPSMCALAEAVRRTGTLAQHNILTIRCEGYRTMSKAVAASKTAPLGWLWDVAGVMSRCSEQISEYQAHSLIGFANHIVDLEVLGDIDQSGEDFDQLCQDHALRAWTLHETALRNRFGPR